MKNLTILIGILVLSSVLVSQSNAQSKIWNQNISQTNINLRGAPVVVGQLTVNVPASGTIVVNFDGSCLSSVGDRIILAASNTTSWGTNDGNVNVQAESSSVPNNSFSHTRSYQVSAGTYTYYAVAENYVNTAGSGKASIYATLTVKFFQGTVDEPFAKFQGIAKTIINVRGSAVVVGQQSITTTQAGYVLVRFDGVCISSVGDRIILAASNTTSWGTNDGNVGVQAAPATVTDNSFSHTRLYQVAVGTYTFYALAQNYVSTAGSGIVSIYGGLTCEFFPNASNHALVLYQGISKTSINVRGNPVTVGQITFNAPYAGKVFVHFDGHSYPADGDRIVLAASSTTSWGTNDGNVGLRAWSTNGSRPFSHTRAYDVAAGSHTFYAVAENYVETSGTGIASIYAGLTVEFYPNLVGGVRIEDEIPRNYILKQNYPNPFNPATTIGYQLPFQSHVTLKVFDVLGREIAMLINAQQTPGFKSVTWNAGNMPNSIYFYRLDATSISDPSNHFSQTRKMVLIK